MVIVDTSIIIEHLRNKERITSFIDLVENESRENIALSVISIQEIFSGQSTKKIKETEFITRLVKGITVLPYDEEIAFLAGKIERDAPHAIEFADAAIAATCLKYTYKLATLNTKDFKIIPYLQLYELN